MSENLDDGDGVEMSADLNKLTQLSARVDFNVRRSFGK